MSNRNILLGLGALAALVIAGIVLLRQIGQEGSKWQQRRVDEVVHVIGELDNQIGSWEEQELQAAWDRGDEATARMIEDSIRRREEAKRALDQQLGKRQPEAAAADVTVPAAPERPPNAAEQMRWVPFLAAAATGTVIGVLGLLGAVVILRMDSGTVANIEVDVAATTEELGSGTGERTQEHTLNARSQLREALDSLKHAEVQLTLVERHLERAARSWTGSQQERQQAALYFRSGILALKDGGITVASEMTERTETWGVGRMSAEEIRAERDDVIALLGLVRFMIAQER